MQQKVGKCYSVSVRFQNLNWWTIHQSDVLVMKVNGMESLEYVANISGHQTASRQVNQSTLPELQILVLNILLPLARDNTNHNILPHFAIYQYRWLYTVCHISLTIAHLLFLDQKIYFHLEDFLHAAWQKCSYSYSPSESLGKL